MTLAPQLSSKIHCSLYEHSDSSLQRTQRKIASASLASRWLLVSTNAPNQWCLLLTDDWFFLSFRLLSFSHVVSFESIIGTIKKFWCHISDRHHYKHKKHDMHSFVARRVGQSHDSLLSSFFLEASSGGYVGTDVAGAIVLLMPLAMII